MKLGKLIASWSVLQQLDGDPHALGKRLTLAGTAVLAVAGRKRAGAVAGGALLLAAGALTRWSVFKAGFASARDPKYTVVPQRERVESRAAG